MNIAQFKVEDWMNEYEKYSIYDLANTTVQNLSFNELFALCDTDKFDFINNLCKQKQGYGHIKGAQELREGISKFYNTIPPENVITTIGAAGANHLVFYSLIEPSDSVVSVIPTYQQLFHTCFIRCKSKTFKTPQRKQFFAGHKRIEKSCYG